ncbi:DUF2141 domain-containing protein [Aequorivita sp. H23M31]|uniref:DUF2141 domain-containing protein n=1 Tax=Aequorivita ciconiae TaxID=2494375 RepID=A0A410G444_9FLAO|nr:DUF2141 domain-containing protein [Aequorivita sp. H23M31]QAA82040.1 DUF2141 domain-containing protein [Aequorivita sp. H23M31]
MNYLFLFLTVFLFHSSSENKELTITISNIKNIEGELVLGLYNNGDRFLEAGEAYKTISRKVESSSEVIVIKNLPLGTYAVSLYHDKNSNGKCDRNFVGIPKEPYGFSNNFKPKFSAPKFEDCKFEFSSNQNLQISLVH